MGSVADFLAQTMLAAANRGAVKPPLGSLDPAPKTPGKPGKGTDAADAAIWDYEPPQIGGGVTVKNLNCRVSNMKYQTMRVCDSIAWGPVTCTWQVISNPATLPLESKFLLESHFLSSGKITGSDVYWKLPANTDQSFEYVFGYEFPDAQLSALGDIGDPYPMSPEGQQSFAPLGAWDLSPGSVFDPDESGSNTLRVPPLRILVVVTLVCCKEKYDFDPGGALAAGRFYPMMMLVSNHDLVSATGKVTITRPTNITMLAEDGSVCNMAVPDPANPGVSTVPMDGEEMTQNLGAVLFTDRNVGTLIPSPAWDDIFDYYDVDPQPGSYVMAVPWEAKVKTTQPVLVTATNAAWNEDETILIVKGRQRSVTKNAGQAEFDNIHVAPKMIIRLADVSSNLLPKEQLKGLDQITMAPFCVHDCMHLHTRWSAANTNMSALGWQDKFTPNAVAGAPLVPPNQKVTINLLSPSSFEYQAEAYDVTLGDWQIMLHHGAGYALNTSGIKAWGARNVVSPHSGVSVSKGAWSMMYWNLRWGIACDEQSHKYQQFERLTWPAAALATLRGTSSDSQGQAKAAGN